jgi:preprotein translocase subunit SecD
MLQKQPLITGEMLLDAQASMDSDHGGWAVSFSLDAVGAKKFAEVTTKNIGKKFAIILDGKVYAGAQGAGGELGHMIIDLHSPASSAGVFGSLEALISRRAIERDIRDAIKSGKKSLIKDLTGGDLKIIRSKTIRKALKKKRSGRNGNY